MEISKIKMGNQKKRERKVQLIEIEETSGIVRK